MDLEEHIRGPWQSGDLREAAKRVIEGYGSEVLGFLIAWMRDDNDAFDVFAQASEDLWTGLPRFEGRSSFRTWFYALARNAASRFRRSPHRRVGRHVPLTAAGQVAERVRSRTLPHLRTEVKDKFAKIRDALDPDDRALIVLRVDRKMSWNDIVRVLAPDDADSREGLARATARLRKRFQVVKEKIRELAKLAGLLPES